MGTLSPSATFRAAGSDRVLRSEPAGIGLRAPHVGAVRATSPRTGWLEVHAENYLDAGGGLRSLLEIRERYEISVHGVGLSLGSDEPLDEAHVRRLRELADIIQPRFVSEHLAFSRLGGVHANALLPLAYTEEALDLFASRVAQFQEHIGRQVLIENPSSYLDFAHSTISEAEFLTELVRRSGCLLLCDLTNLYVSSVNLGFDSARYLLAMPKHAIAEFHLAGHTANSSDSSNLLLDSHSCPVSEPVWELYSIAVEHFGPLPTLIEWDTRLPDLAVLLEEAAHADEVMARALRRR